MSTKTCILQLQDESGWGDIVQVKSSISDIHWSSKSSTFVNKVSAKSRFENSAAILKRQRNVFGQYFYCLCKTFCVNCAVENIDVSGYLVYLMIRPRVGLVIYWLVRQFFCGIWWHGALGLWFPYNVNEVSFVIGQCLLRHCYCYITIITGIGVILLK